ncbi:hypothetical protein FJT64_012123 [Amphibalanus amphitrite]|uniref:C-type lectin domain-containing protein n=1 Tax=Amphibalanus amphitrite TaxID=1232801 RepID=A0A6A4V7P8_AMPAM|nr:hypothetical protein FJT64_012123 [Amphibalanus amphitrite]
MMRPAHVSLLLLGLLAALDGCDTSDLYRFGSGTRAGVAHIRRVVSSRLHCGFLCSKSSECFVWRYTQDTGTCQLFNMGSISESAAYFTPVPPPSDFVMGPDNIAYLMVPTLMDRSTAEQHCQSLDPRATLAVPVTETAFAFLKEKADLDGWGTNTMLGVKCIGSSFASIATATTISIPLTWFDPGSVTECMSNMCLVIEKTGLEDDSCSHEHQFLCQIHV